MSEHVNKFVDDLANGNNAEAGEAFKDALRDKVATSLDQARVDIAKNIFTGQVEQPISDPKPEYTGPNDRTDAIFDDQGQQIEFTPNENPQPEAEAPQAPVEAEAPADETQ
jgi:hypothetical protein